MFNIYFIQAGWMPVSFGERKLDTVGYTLADSREVIYFSYIDYVKDEFDNLFNLSDNQEKSYEFDLEGDVIKISTKLNGSNIDIHCEYLYSNEEPKAFDYSFPYADFLKDYVEEFSDNKKTYLKDFHYDEPDFSWENENWNEILTKIQN